MRPNLIRAYAVALVILAAMACGKAAKPVRNDTATATPAPPPAVSATTSTESPDSTLPTDSVAEVIVRYYDAIQRRDFAAAYALWSDGGRASGLSRDAFAAGFAQTARVSATITGKVSVEGAAGSQYATVPVEVSASLLDGTEQHFAGSYVVRRAMVDGATREQRQWRIYSASIRPR